MAALPCSRKCGCQTERMVEDGEGGEVALCLWCEDGLPCEAAMQAGARPIRKLFGEKASLTVRVPHPETTDLEKKPLSIEQVLSIRLPGGQILKRPKERKERQEVTMSTHRTKGETLGENLARAIELAKQGKRSGDIAKALGVKPWMVYQSDGLREYRDKNPPGSFYYNLPGISTIISHEKADDKTAGLVPVFLSEAALNRVWRSSSLEEKAAMIGNYLAQVEPA